MSRPSDTRGRWFVTAEEEELERLEDEEREASIGPTDDEEIERLEDEAFDPGLCNVHGETCGNCGRGLSHDEPCLSHAPFQVRF